MARKKSPAKPARKARRAAPQRVSPQQDRFCHEYLIDFNGTRAYRAAGYKAKNDNVAAVGASKLLRLAKVQARLAQLRERYDREVHERVVVNKENVIRELARLGFADIREAVEWNSGSLTLKSSSEISADVAAAIKEVRFTKEGIALKLHDKVTPLTRLGDHLGMKAPQVPLKAKVRLVLPPVSEAARRAAG